MDNHGLLELSGMPQWRTVTGGSQRYVEAITAPFVDRIRLHSPVRKIVRRHDGEGGIEIELMSPTYGLETFDRVILASHSDQAPAPAERRRPPPSARSWAPSATSPTSPPCTPTSGSCPATPGPGPAGTTTCTGSGPGDPAPHGPP